MAAPDWKLKSTTGRKDGAASSFLAEHGRCAQFSDPSVLSLAGWPAETMGPSPAPASEEEAGDCSWHRPVQFASASGIHH